MHQQERVACRFVVRVGRQLDRDPGRTLQSEGRGRDDRARERGEGEATNPRLHDNLRIGVVGEMPPPAGEFERLPRDPIHAASGEEVQLPTRVFAERQGAAWAQVEVPARLPAYHAARVAEAPHPSRAQVRVEVLTGERGKPGATVDESADDGALSVGVVVLDRGRDQSGGGAWIRVVAWG